MHVLYKRDRAYRLLIKYLCRDESVSLQELEDEGKAWVALTMIHGPCMHGDGFYTTKLTLS